MIFKRTRMIAVLMFAVFFLLTTIALSQTKLDKKFEEKVFPEPASVSADFDEEIILSGGKVELKPSVDIPGVRAGGVFIIQFSKALTDQDVNLLSSKGALLMEYVGANAYRVRVTAGNSLPETGLLRSALKPGPEHKKSPLLAKKLSYLKSGEKVKIVVTFAEDVSREKASQILAVAGFELSGSYNDKRVFIEATAETVELISQSEDVVAVEMNFRKKVHNKKSARLIGVKTARNSYNLSGDGIKVGIWDGGKVYASHKEFGGRVTLKTSDSYSDHATHVAGSIMAAGVKSMAKGMANEASLYSHDFNGDIAAEAKKAKTGYGVILSNHSYGYGKGWEIDYINDNIGWGWIWWGKDLFGKYTTESKSLDNAITGKKLIMVYSAGNDRNDDPKGEIGYYDALKDRWVNERAVGKDGPYNTLGPLGVPKNVITVGATVGNKSMSTFSSWGPTDDGRLKPEVSAPGVNIYSTVAYNGYGRMSGTSMAAPVTTGSIAVVMEHYQNLYGSVPWPDMIKALLAATAKDLSPVGPDYKYGFGVIDIDILCDFLAENPNMELVEINTVNKGKTNTYDLTVGDNVKELKVCLAWLDPSGAKLVNNLDLKLISPQGKDFLPWKLNPANPSKSATKGVNSLDNIEMVTLTNPASSDKWKIHVKASSLKRGSSQKYALIVFPN